MEDSQHMCRTRVHLKVIFKMWKWIKLFRRGNREKKMMKGLEIESLHSRTRVAYNGADGARMVRGVEESHCYQ